MLLKDSSTGNVAQHISKAPCDLSFVALCFLVAGCSTADTSTYNQKLLTHPGQCLLCCCLQDAAKTAAEKMGAAADAVTGHAKFPEYPPGSGKASNYDNIGSSSSSQGKQGRADSSPASTDASSAGGYSDDKSVGDWVQQGAEKLKESLTDTAGAAAERVPSGQEAAAGLGDALRSTARTAADYGSSETSERLTEMSSQSEQQQGLQDSSSRGTSSSSGGGGSSVSSGGLQEGFTWGDVSGLSEFLGMGEAVEGGYYAYRSTDDAAGQFGSSSSSVDPLSSRSFRRRSARGSRGVTDPSPYTPHSSVDGLAFSAAAGGGGFGRMESAAAADMPHAAAAAASGGDLSATAGERGSGGSGSADQQQKTDQQHSGGLETAMPATATASASIAAASDAGWDTADQK
jgi:hypothetical protein